MKIVEKGISLEEYPETYLAKRKKDVEKNKSYSVIFNEVIKLLKELRWQDIVFIDGGRSGSEKIEIPVFPENIRTKIKEAFRENNQKAKGDLMKGSLAFAKTHNNEDPASNNSIYMKVDGSQRSHFPNEGIPSALRGTNLGYKLYRALIQKYKWLTSNVHGTTEKDYVWQSIVSNIHREILLLMMFILS